MTPFIIVIMSKGHDYVQQLGVSHTIPVRVGHSLLTFKCTLDFRQVQNSWPNNGLFIDGCVTLRGNHRFRSSSACYGHGGEMVESINLSVRVPWAPHYHQSSPTCTWRPSKKKH